LPCDAAPNALATLIGSRIRMAGLPWRRLLFVEHSATRRRGIPAENVFIEAPTIDLPID
jgi:hypothetical protein